MDEGLQHQLSAWEATAQVEETSDPLWQLLSYRLARYLIDCATADGETARRTVDPATISQVLRAVSSIAANVSEGYSRRTAADRARFYSYALGSTRESMVWYRSIAFALHRDTLALRMAALAQERRLLIGLLKAVQRASGLKFDP